MANFKEELKALLDKYNATISFECSDSSDLHGVYNEKIVISNRFQTFISIDGYNINSSDIK